LVMRSRRFALNTLECVYPQATEANFGVAHCRCLGRRVFRAHGSHQAAQVLHDSCWRTGKTAMTYIRCLSLTHNSLQEMVDLLFEQAKANPLVNSTDLCA
jgi:hypothetical protein